MPPKAAALIPNLPDGRKSPRKRQRRVHFDELQFASDRDRRALKRQNQQSIVDSQPQMTSKQRQAARRRELRKKKKQAKKERQEAQKQSEVAQKRAEEKTLRKIKEKTQKYAEEEVRRKAEKKARNKAQNKDILVNYLIAAQASRSRHEMELDRRQHRV